MAARRHDHSNDEEYFSLDDYVVKSPLIFVGEVEKVEKGHIAPPKTRLWDVPMLQDEATVGTVKVLRVLKGRYLENHVRIGSGLVHHHTMCSIGHLHFDVGQQSLFVLPSYPKNGEVAAMLFENMLPLTDIAKIESRIARAKAFRDAYLIELQKEQPKVYAAAVQFADEMRQAATTWPQDDMDSAVPAGWYKTGFRDLEQKVAKVDVEVIRAALAIDWLAEDPVPWSRKDVWNDIVKKINASRTTEIDESQNRWIRKTLTRAAVENEYIDKYIDALKRANRHGFMGFPFVPSSDYEFFRHRPLTAQALTTDFILRCQGYFQEIELGVCRKDSKWALLPCLQPNRIKQYVAALYGDENEELRSYAQTIIGRVPGTAFVDLVLNDMGIEGHERAWKALDHPDCPKETAPRLAAMIDLASKRSGNYGAVQLWGLLRRGECFEQICIEKAMDTLEHAEKEEKAASTRATAKDNDRKSPAEFRLEEENRIRQKLIDTLHAYLAAAKASREEQPKRPSLSTAEYRRWFKEHPLPPKEDVDTEGN
jgi:hypothetical protein